METEASKANFFCVHSESNLMMSIALVSRCFDLRLAKKLMIGATSLDNMKQNHKQLCRGRSRLSALYQELSHKYLLPVQPVRVVTLNSVTILHSTKRLLNKPQALYQTFSVLCGIHKNVEIHLDQEDLKWNFWAASDPFSSREAFRLNCWCVEAIHHG